MKYFTAEITIIDERTINTFIVAHRDKLKNSSTNTVYKEQLRARPLLAHISRVAQE